jgi:hypothetical protein
MPNPTKAMPDLNLICTNANTGTIDYFCMANDIDTSGMAEREFLYLC